MNNAELRHCLDTIAQIQAMNKEAGLGELGVAAFRLGGRALDAVGRRLGGSRMAAGFDNAVQRTGIAPKPMAAVTQPRFKQVIAARKPAEPAFRPVNKPVADGQLSLDQKINQRGSLEKQRNELAATKTPQSQGGVPTPPGVPEVKKPNMFRLTRGQAVTIGVAGAGGAILGHGMSSPQPQYR